MRNFFIYIFIFFIAQNYVGRAQDMTNDDLENIIYVVADSLRGDTGNWHFMISNRILICITDQNTNRMLIMSPIIKQNKIARKDLKKMLQANFHTALDVKYAIFEDVLWSVFMHPLKELSKDEVLSAINQVYSAAETYGTTFSSLEPIFSNKDIDMENKNRKI
jgi:hypothetical protein